MSATIRRAAPGDADALSKLKIATFRETFVEGFAIPYPPEEQALFEEASLSRGAVAAELADTGCATWIAGDGEEMIGYATVGACKLPHPDALPGAGELRQLYLRAPAQGLGLGRDLLDMALDHLAITRPGPVWLGVWSGNLRAQHFYAARGFAKVGDYRFPVGRNWHDEEFIFRRP